MKKIKLFLPALVFVLAVAAAFGSTTSRTLASIDVSLQSTCSRVGTCTETLTGPNCTDDDGNFVVKYFGVNSCGSTFKGTWD